ncbi:MAG: hypothetical protein ACYS0G_04710 [Planctomycetota bacterium]|jgi:hypothetical protein
MTLRILVGSVAVAATAIAVAQLRVGGEIGQDEGRTLIDEIPEGDHATGGSAAGVIGPDVIYSNCQAVANWGAVGGIRGYSLGSHTCNVGDENLLWGNTHDGTPGLAMNAYRLHDGRLMQVGMSWVKHACCAAAGSGCGLPCNGQGGSVLGVGCRDIYSASYNGGQSRLGPRSDLNPYTGDWQPAPGGSGNDIYKRLQVAEADLVEADYPGALYFVEGVYVGVDDAQSANWLNNASYKRVTVGNNFSLDVTGSMYETIPAIFAWRDHGNGVDNPDNSVKVSKIDVPDEGRFIVGVKTTDNGDDTWRYEYAIFNLNSHRSAGSFSVPIPPSVNVTNVGFHDVDYHSGELYDNTDWDMTVEPTGVTWSSPATFDEDPNTNALRWGTMYNFWFDADAPPADDQVTIGLFRPGVPESITPQVLVPVADACPWDCGNADGSVDIADLLALLAQWGGPGACDIDGGGVGISDLLALLGNWGICP